MTRRYSIYQNQSNSTRNSRYLHHDRSQPQLPKKFLPPERHRDLRRRKGFQHQDLRLELRRHKNCLHQMLRHTLRNNFLHQTIHQNRIHRNSCLLQTRHLDLRQPSSLQHLVSHLGSLHLKSHQHQELP